ncbi:serine O-acetyltransferase EpsC [Derxia lacustris]|uniref:serine O-acetyltransferase EpsC n=1 Tax=Derxia lacustris TaxID=764842 RepID=UPI000A172112
MPMDTPTDSNGTDFPQWDLSDIVARLRDSREVTHNIRHRGRIREYPSREALIRVLDGLACALFPTHFGRRVLTDASIDFFVGHTLNETLSLLREQVRRGLMFDAGHEDVADDAIARDAARVTATFAARLPEIRGLLVSDLHAAYQGDPAATCTAEILLSYPGMRAIIHHRVAHALYTLGAKLLARVIAEIAHSQTGVDIHPGASIGGSFFIDHGTGVVIGETAILGERVRLYQAVTLGAKRFETADDGSLVKGNARHPIVEDDVVIYAGATVLGRIVIGKGSTIGGNVWVTQSLPPGSVVTQAQSRQT